MRASFAVEEDVRALGANLRYARVRRRLTQAVVAERAGISLNTLSKIEKGDCGVAIGSIASVLQALGFDSPLALLCAPESDPEGFMNEAARMPQRVRARKGE